MVVKGKPATKARPQFGPSLEDMQVNLLVLPRSPQALDEDVVHPAPTPVRADFDLCRTERASEGIACELGL